MTDTVQEFKGCVMTDFLKAVAPIVVDRASRVTADTGQLAHAIA